MFMLSEAKLTAQPSCRALSGLSMWREKKSALASFSMPTFLSFVRVMPVDYLVLSVLSNTVKVDRLIETLTIRIRMGMGVPSLTN